MNDTLTYFEDRTKISSFFGWVGFCGSFSLGFSKNIYLTEVEADFCVCYFLGSKYRTSRGVWMYRVVLYFGGGLGVVTNLAEKRQKMDLDSFRFFCVCIFAFFWFDNG